MQMYKFTRMIRVGKKKILLIRYIYNDINKLLIYIFYNIRYITDETQIISFPWNKE